MRSISFNTFIEYFNSIFHDLNVLQFADDFYPEIAYKKLANGLTTLNKAITNCKKLADGLDLSIVKS